MTRLCKDCGEVKDLNLFVTALAEKYGKGYYCKLCDNKRTREYKARNRQKHRDQNKNWCSQNRDKRKEYQRKHRQENIQARLAHNLRNRLNSKIKNTSKAGSAVKDLECSLEELKTYLESKFVPEMSWNNYGKWHIDHIKPLASFDLTHEEEFLKAVHYTNLQPLWAKDNLIKSDKFIE